MSEATVIRSSRLTRDELARMIREHPDIFGDVYREEVIKDKSYQLLPLGREAEEYLRAKKKRLTEASYRDVESSLDKFARHFPGLHLSDLEPPRGTQLIEDFLEYQWGHREPRTYNKNLSYLREFFKHQVKRGKMHGDPTLLIERARARQVYRTTFNADQRRAIIAEQEGVRDRLALRLLLDYALRKGSLRAVQFKHFDHVRKRLTIFAKGGKVRTLPLPDPAFWHDLERLILDSQAEPHHYLMQRAKGNGSAKRYFPEEPMGAHGMHDWWYRCLANAGIVPEGTTKGEKMHKARHSAGQRLLDNTGNLKAVQRLLGHESIQTTGDIYVDWDEEQLAASLMEAMKREGDE